MKRVQLYNTPSGKKVISDFIRGLTNDDKRKLTADISTLQYGYPLGMPLCKQVAGKIWELRSNLPSGNTARLLYFFDDESQLIIVVHAFIKKTKTTPREAIELAKGRMKEFI